MQTGAYLQESFVGWLVRATKWHERAIYTVSKESYLANEQTRGRAVRASCDPQGSRALF
jgi:hypothetical protein